MTDNLTDFSGDNKAVENDNINYHSNKQVVKPIWVSVSEAAKLGGVQTKTIRRAIQFNYVKYKIVSNRYLIDLVTLITYLHSKTKLYNKLKYYGLGQYVDKWK
jgi:hypothetical protein